MATFLKVSLSKEEEIFLTGIIVEMAVDGQKLSEEDVLHELISMAQSHSKLDMAKRELRKLRKKYETKSEVDRLFLGKSQAYNKALDLLD